MVGFETLACHYDGMVDFFLSSLSLRFREIKSCGGPLDGGKIRFRYMVVLSTACSRLLLLVVPRFFWRNYPVSVFHGDEALTACEAVSINLPIQLLEVVAVILLRSMASRSDPGVFRRSLRLFSVFGLRSVPVSVCVTRVSPRCFWLTRVFSFR
ncbi:hypothetical protein YC2023_093800 [Brassica napus]